jgi:hypothetical protein
VAFQEALSAKDSGLNNAQGGGTGDEEEPPPEEEFGFVFINLLDGYLTNLEKAMGADALLFDVAEFTRLEDTPRCNDGVQSRLHQEREGVELKINEDLYVNHGGTKQMGEPFRYVDTFQFDNSQYATRDDQFGIAEEMQVTME